MPIISGCKLLTNSVWFTKRFWFPLWWTSGDEGRRSNPPAVKCEPSVAAWCHVAPRTHPDPRSERWKFCRICCHSNQVCSGRWAPQQPPGTGHRSGSLIGRRGWSAARSLVEGFHRTAHWERSRLDRISLLQNYLLDLYLLRYSSTGTKDGL